MPAKAKKKENATKNKKKKETLSTAKIKVVVKRVEKSKKRKGWKKEKRKQYSHESLEKALQAVNKGMSYRKAAEMFGVITRPTGDRSKEALQENVQYHSKILSKESGHCEISKENNESLSNSDNNADQNKSFAKAFTLPTEYLPKKKRIKLEATGKHKLPSVGTSEEWWKVQMEKEQQKKIKQEK